MTYAADEIDRALALVRSGLNQSQPLHAGEPRHHRAAPDPPDVDRELVLAALALSAPSTRAGSKHDRLIKLESWQQRLVQEHPWRFLRGLIHSDGCRHMNPAIHPHKTYWYPRYSFCNHSMDIQRLFCETCDLVGVHWTQMNRWNISVARRADVAEMDQHIGPKR